MYFFSFVIPVYFYIFWIIQTFITWPQVVHFYCFKAYFGAFIELHFVLYITQKWVSAPSYPFSQICSHNNIIIRPSMNFILSFSQRLVNRHATFFFIPLCCQLINEESVTCKRMIAETLKLILTRVSIALLPILLFSLYETHKLTCSLKPCAALKVNCLRWLVQLVLHCTNEAQLGWNSCLQFAL